MKELSVTSFTELHSFFLPMCPGLLTRHAGFMGNELVTLSNELAGAVERAAGGVVAVFARPHIGSSGVIWRQNLILTSSAAAIMERTLRSWKPIPAARNRSNSSTTPR